MVQPQFLPTNRNAGADQSILENDTYNTTAVSTSFTLSGRDSLTDTIGVAKTFKVATPNYSKRPFGKVNSLHFSLV
jgi:hypothetical protein